MAAPSYSMTPLCGIDLRTKKRGFESRGVPTSLFRNHTLWRCEKRHLIHENDEIGVLITDDPAREVSGLEGVKRSRLQSERKMYAPFTSMAG